MLTAETGNARSQNSSQGAERSIQLLIVGPHERWMIHTMGQSPPPAFRSRFLGLSPSTDHEPMQDGPSDPILVIAGPLAGDAVISRLADWRGRARNMPAVVLAEQPDPAYVVELLNEGASDVIRMPCHPIELFARLRVLAQRGSQTAEDRLVLDDLELDTASGLLRSGANAVRLSLEECAVLALLMRNRGLTVGYDEIHSSVWPPHAGRDCGIGIVHVYISYLRGKLARFGQSHRIQTVRRAGYVLRSDKRLLAVRQRAASDRDES